MNYRQFLIDRHRLAFTDESDPRVLDYMSLRNRDAVGAWHRRMSQFAQALSPDLNARKTQWLKRSGADETKRE